MNLQNPPEVADGGYWYVLDAVPDADQGGKTPGAIPNVGWCAWYIGMKVILRCTSPISGLNNLGSSAEALSAAGYIARPLGRVGGS